MDPELLAEELSEAARRARPLRGVIAVDVYGQCADYERIESLCRGHEVPLIEDAAEALGATYQGRPAGTFGRFGCFSFNGNKIITTSGGGMLATADAEAATRARFLATQARDPAPHYEHSQIGYNYRLSNLLAAVGRGQLEVLADRVARRRANFEFYREALATCPASRSCPNRPPAAPPAGSPVSKSIPRTSGPREKIFDWHWNRPNIEARPVWKPMHLQPAFAHCRTARRRRLAAFVRLRAVPSQRIEPGPKRSGASGGDDQEDHRALVRLFDFDLMSTPTSLAGW